MAATQPERHVTLDVLEDPRVQLAALCPLCALAAYSPAAALAAISPVLRLFNPAINPAAALLSFALGMGEASVKARVASRVSTRLNGLVIKAQQSGLVR